MAHFPCCVCTRVACTSRRSTNSDGLVFPLFVLWVCAYDFEKFSEVPSSKSRCVAPIKHKRSGASSLDTTFTHLSTQIANQQHKALRHADDSLMFKASVQEKYPASSSYVEENALMIVRGQRSGQSEVCRTASLGTWCTWEASVWTPPLAPRHCDHLICLGEKGNSFLWSQFSCSRLNVTLKCLWSIPCPVSSGADTSSATKLISVKTLVCRCVFLPAADKPGWRSCSVFHHTWPTVANSNAFKCGQISPTRGNETQMHDSRGVI